MEELVKFLFENMFIDFTGQVDQKIVLDFLNKDTSREAMALKQKIMEDGGIEELLEVLSECLKDYIRDGIDEEVIKEQLIEYAES